MRPKRSTSKKVITDEVAEDNLDLSEESSGDFSSASSDEYDPRKEKGMEDTYEESASDEEEEEEEESSSYAESPAKKM